MIIIGENNRIVNFDNVFSIEIVSQPNTKNELFGIFAMNTTNSGISLYNNLTKTEAEVMFNELINNIQNYYNSNKRGGIC